MGVHLQLKDSAIYLQARDFWILGELCRSQFMAIAQISALHFGGRVEAAKKRLQKLRSVGLISLLPITGSKASAVVPTSKAIRIAKLEILDDECAAHSLREVESLAGKRKWVSQHDIEVIDMRVAFGTVTCSSHDNPMLCFTTNSRMIEFSLPRAFFAQRPTLIRPDGFLHQLNHTRNGIDTERACFLELDRSTENLDTLITRAGHYLIYYKSGGFAARCGAPRSEYKKHPFRLLIVLKSAERRNNVIEGLLRSTPPILTMAWLSTFEEAKADPLGPVWIRPFDYRQSMFPKNGVPPAPCRPGQYRRQTERDLLVEKLVPKRRLFGDN